MSATPPKPWSAAYLRILNDWDELEYSIRQISRGSDFLCEMEGDMRSGGPVGYAEQLAFLNGAISQYVVNVKATMEKIEATLRRDPEV